MFIVRYSVILYRTNNTVVISAIRVEIIHYYLRLFHELYARLTRPLISAQLNLGFERNTMDRCAFFWKSHIFKGENSFWALDL